MGQPLCFLQEESVKHLFYLCQVVNVVWRDIQHWLGVSVIDVHTGVEHLHAYGTNAKHKKVRRVKYLIWIATMWCIWLHSHVKSMSSWWFISNVGRFSEYSISDWWVNPNPMSD